MNAPQIVMIVLMALNLGIALEEHGKPKTGNHNVFIHVVSLAITVGLLWWGGFWS